MGDAVGIRKYPLGYVYIAPRGYVFYKNGENIGRIVLLRTDELNGVYVDLE